MPKQFNDCQNKGGKIRTKTINSKQYAHVCISKSGKTSLGEVRTKQSK